MVSEQVRNVPPDASNHRDSTQACQSQPSKSTWRANAYALRGMRHAILEGAGVADLWGDIWPLLVIGAISIPLGLWVFRLGEQYAKRHGKLKRAG